MYTRLDFISVKSSVFGGVGHHIKGTSCNTRLD